MAEIPEAKTIRYTLDGKIYDLDLKSITLKERIEVEEFLGMPWAKANAEGWLFSEKGQAFFAFIIIRRRRPTLTLDEILGATELKVELNPKDRSTKRPTKSRGTNGSRS